jgi:hypothetical protein
MRYNVLISDNVSDVMTSDRWPVVKVIVESLSLSLHDGKHVLTSPLSEIRVRKWNKRIMTHIHHITPVSHRGWQRSLPSTCYDPYTHLSLLLFSSKPSLLQTYHSHFIPEGQAEISRTFLRDTHILPKWFSYKNYCRRNNRPSTSLQRLIRLGHVNRRNRFSMKSRFVRPLEALVSIQNTRQT